MTPEILFENTHILIINKPARLLVHADGKREEKTLVDWIKNERPEMVGVGEPMSFDKEIIERPGIVHRLDEETSGVLVLAKTTESFANLKRQFQEHKIVKQYHAFVWGTFKERLGIIDAPIGRSKNDFRRYNAGRGTRGVLRDALTKWGLAGTIQEGGVAYSFLHLFPKTGRTHQLRVHMKYLQHPIVSDDLYAPEKPPALGFSRVALHARSITVTDLTGEEIAVSAPYPKDFERALAMTKLL